MIRRWFLIDQSTCRTAMRALHTARRGPARTFTKFAMESRARPSLAVTMEEERDEVERRIADAHSLPVDYAARLQVAPPSAAA
jgi:hypothetical protein